MLQQTSPGSYTFTIIWSNRGLLCMILSSKNSRAKGSIHCSSPLIMHQTDNIAIDLCNCAGPWWQCAKAHCLTTHTAPLRHSLHAPHLVHWRFKQVLRLGSQHQGLPLLRGKETSDQHQPIRRCCPHLPQRGYARWDPARPLRRSSVGGLGVGVGVGVLTKYLPH